MSQLIFSFILGFYIKKVRVKFGKQVAHKIRPVAKRAYKELLPFVPKVGGTRIYFASIVVANGWFIATYKAMKSVGCTVDDSMMIWAEMIDDLFRKMPGWMQERIGGFLTSDGTIKSFHKQAMKSQLKKFPADWVYQVNVIEGVDLTFEFDECAAIKMYKELGGKK